jgi:hypothetical protein
MKPRSTGIQAKDVDTDALLRLVAPASIDERWTMFSWLVDNLPAVPPKVLRAKLAKLIKQGLLDGCVCGCRGDFELTPAGAARIGVELPSAFGPPTVRIDHTQFTGPDPADQILRGSTITLTVFPASAGKPN